VLPHVLLISAGPDLSNNEELQGKMKIFRTRTKTLNRIHKSHIKKSKKVEAALNDIREADADATATVNATSPVEHGPPSLNTALQDWAANSIIRLFRDRYYTVIELQNRANDKLRGMYPFLKGD
jgi:hypothetical protein